MKFLAGLMLVMISSTAFAATSEKYGMGGRIQKFQPEIDRANASGELFRIRGHCQSNCTLFLGFANAGSTNRMLNAYNAGLRQYVVDNHYMDTLAFHTISGAAMIDKFGYRECPRK